MVVHTVTQKKVTTCHAQCYAATDLDSVWNPIPYAEASCDYVCKTSAATSSHVQNLHITETTIYVGNILFSDNIHVYWLCVRNIYMVVK